MLDFKLPPNCECCTHFCIFWVIPRRQNFMCWRFGTLSSVFIARVNTTYEDITECSETSAHKVQTQGNHPKERLHHHTFWYCVADGQKYRNAFHVGLSVVLVFVVVLFCSVVIWVYHWMKKTILTQWATWVLLVLFSRDSKENSIVSIFKS